MTSSRAPEKPAPRAWQRMLSGRRLDLLNPTPMDVEIEDIAHGLSRVARWNGQTTGAWAFSVAQHSVMVEALAVEATPGLSPAWRLAALLHDASEYVVGDMISPFKTAVGYDYRKLEKGLQAAVHLRFGLPADPPAEIARKIKRADRQSAYLEATQIAGFSAAEARRLWGAPPKVRIAGPFDAAPQAPDAAKAGFLKRFEALTAAMARR